MEELYPEIQWKQIPCIEDLLLKLQSKDRQEMETERKRLRRIMQTEKDRKLRNMNLINFDLRATRIRHDMRKAHSATRNMRHLTSCLEYALLYGCKLRRNNFFLSKPYYYEEQVASLCEENKHWLYYPLIANK